MSMIERTCACGCGKKFMAREADVRRGWGKYATKSCKATAQERRTHQHRNYMRSGVTRETFLHHANEYGGNPQFHNGEYVGFTGGFSNEEHDCNKD